MSMKQLWWDWWKQREDTSTGGQMLSSGPCRFLQDLQKSQPVGYRRLNQHNWEGRAPQTSGEDGSPGQWNGGAQLFQVPSSTGAICRDTSKALVLIYFSHILKIGREASTSLWYFGKFYSAFLQLLSIFLSMVPRCIHGTYTNSMLPWLLSATAGTPWRTSPALLHTPARRVWGDDISGSPGSSAPLSSRCQMGHEKAHSTTAPGQRGLSKEMLLRPGWRWCNQAERWWLMAFCRCLHLLCSHWKRISVCDCRKADQDESTARYAANSRQLAMGKDVSYLGFFRSENSAKFSSENLIQIVGTVCSQFWQGREWCMSNSIP